MNHRLVYRVTAVSGFGSVKCQLCVNVNTVTFVTLKLQIKQIFVNNKKKSGAFQTYSSITFNFVQLFINGHILKIGVFFLSRKKQHTNEAMIS